MAAALRRPGSLVMLDERKTAILRAVVQEYVRTAQPVGSAHVVGAAGISVSPATVRNEMAVLEQEGYLAQPHTSAGRVPTDKGYRFYVDHLSAPGRLDEVRAEQVRDFFSGAHGAIEQMLHDTSRLLTRLTNYTAVVVGPAHEVASLRSVQLVGLSARSVLLVVVLSGGVVDKTLVELAEEVGEEVVAAASAHLQAHLVGASVGGLPAVPPTGNPAVDRLSDQATQALASLFAQEEDHEHVFVGGTSSLAAAFDAVDVVRDVLRTLEQQYVVVSLLKDVLDRGLSVAIGTEHGVEQLAACSVVVASYSVEGEAAGTIGLLGPTRMDYPRALAAVDVVSDGLGRRLSEGG